MNVLIEPNFLYVNCTDQQAKQLDAIWIKSKNAFRLPNTLGALRELHRLGYDVMEYGKKKAQIRKDFLELKENENPAFELDQRLRPYQRIDISFLSQLPHAGVFSEQRTGKSVVALKVFEVEERKKNLIVCPASLVLNWSNEIKKFTNKTPFPVSGSKIKRLKTYNEFKVAEEGYLIISKETLRQDVDIIEAL